MQKSKIEWCTMVWNPVTGCKHGCEYCYARIYANRFGGRWAKGIEPLDSFGGNNIHNGDGNLHDLNSPMQIKVKGRTAGQGTHMVNAPFPYCFDPTFHRYRLEKPQLTKKPQNVFVCSMADLFGAWVSYEWLEKIFDVCNGSPQHRFLFLTKNPKRYIQLAKNGLLPNGENYWYGTTTPTETTEYFFNDAMNYFVSIEPIQVQTSFCEFETDRPPKWVIVGAETGNRKDKVIPKKEWIDGIVSECRSKNIPVFLKNNLKEIWGEPLIQEYPWETPKNKGVDA